jgi:hypothetical protein
VAARELFRLGTEDADAGRFEDGFEKFKRVAAVKETAAVRFNLARCEEALGKTGTALADFELAEREGRQDKAEDVSKLAHDRADALRPRVPRLTLVPPSPVPQGMVVSLDGGKLASATLGVPLPVDPGSHVIDVTAPASSPFHAQFILGVGEAKSVSLALSVPTSPPSAADEFTPAVRENRASSSQPTWGWVAIAAGGVLGAGSALFLVLHNNAVSTVSSDCPNLHCPASLQGQVESNQSNAGTYDAVAIALVAASALAIGTGVALIATAPKTHAPAPIAITPGAPGAPAGLSLHVTF